jgi:2-polyprenyl-6-hydroxyphenyl methylase/3-demethylubiquinone-9 3-methyltransferase
MTRKGVNSDYRYTGSSLNESHLYLLPAVKRILRSLDLGDETRSIFEIGCGNGSVAWELSQLGYKVIGIDSSPTGIAQANAAYPGLRLEQGSTYDSLVKYYGTFPVVLSLEVIEHLYDPRVFVHRAFELLEEGGTFIASTPYHGYFKNLALALCGKLDDHFTVLWDGGHIKFFSIRSLSTLLAEAGFTDIHFVRVGRIALLAKSMIAVAKKPTTIR